MPIYAYKIETTVGKADGSIEADSSDEAQAKLRKQYVHNPKDGKLTDEDGKKLKHEIIDIQVTEL